ncbi:MAG: hypothetical protein WCT05_12820 [Lentisphaeria bacterium]
MTKLKDKVFSWGYVLDQTPTAAPFVFGKSQCSLETASAYLGVKKTFYNNSMFSVEYIQKHFPKWEPECIDNCIRNRLSDLQLQRLSALDEIFCTLEHGRYLDSARQIAQLSLRYPNIKGIHIDDFNQSSTSETYQSPVAMKQLRDTVKSINPKLQIAVVTYSHLPIEVQVTPFVEYVDIFSRWCWVPSPDYWDQHARDIEKVRAVIGREKKIIQGIYIHDFGTSMFCQYPVPMEIFKKSLIACCENTCNGILDGFIIPQSGWFATPSHYEHISWMKNYLDWCDNTTTFR